MQTSHRKHSLVLFSIFIVAMLVLASVFALTLKSTALANRTSTDTIDFGTDGITLDDQSAMGELITVLGGESCTSYNELSAQIDDNGVKNASSFASAKTVTLGGIAFNIVYVSKADYTANGTSAGDIIVTLWMAQSSITSKWNTVSSDRTDVAYPTNMYSSSLIRSTLVGSNYLTTAGAATLDGTGTINESWAPFNKRGAFYSYLATPANMAWQETLSSVDIRETDYNYINEAWGAPSKGQFYSYNVDSYDYSLKNGNSDWKNDRIWLPALTETGTSTTAGLWKTDLAHRYNTSHSWLRTGYYNAANRVSHMNYSSGGSMAYNITTVFAVRPAIHLNLSAIF